MPAGRFTGLGSIQGVIGSSGGLQSHNTMYPAVSFHVNILLF